MKKIHVTKFEFDDIIWPAFAASNSKDIAQIDTVVSVAEVLKSASKEVPHPELRRNIDRELDGDKATLALENADWKFLTDRIKELFPSVRNAFIPEYRVLLKKFEDALDVVTKVK